MSAGLFKTSATVIKIDDLNALENEGWSGIIAPGRLFCAQPALLCPKFRAITNHKQPL